MDDEKIRYDGQLGVLNADLRDKQLTAYQLRAMTRNATIWEMPGCTMLHFPYDSAGPTIDDDVELYLQSIVHSLDTSTTWIKLRTIVEEQPQSTEDTLLGWRMRILRDRIISKGMPERRVLIGMDDNDIPVGCVPDEFEDETRNWIALIFTK
jgi:hypothetical protein